MYGKSWSSSAAALAVFATLRTVSVSALSSADIASVFSDTQNLTGSAVLLPEFVLSIMANTTHALISLNGSAPVAEVGWWATAVGTGMANADFLVAWPNTGSANISWTLSHRDSTGFVQPTVASTSHGTTTNNFYTLIPSLSTSDPNSPSTVVSFLRPLVMPASYQTTSKYPSISRAPSNFLYASCSQRPPTSDEAAPIGKHDQEHSTVVIDLSKKASLTAVSEGAGGPDNRPSWSAESWPAERPGVVKGPLTRRDKILAAHAGIGSVALLLFSPLAILVARYTRHLNIPWFKIHATVQIAAYTLIFVAFSLGVYAAKSPHFSNSHTRLGLVIFTFLTCQIALGLVAHKTPAFRTSVTPPDPNNLRTTAFTTIKGKPFARLAHIAFGLTITILGWCQIRLGLEEWVDYSDSGNDIPPVVIVIFWALVGVESAEVFLGRFMKEEMNHDAVNRALSSRYNSTSRVNSRLGGSAVSSRIGGTDMSRQDTEGTVGTQPPAAGTSLSLNLPETASAQRRRDRDSDELTVVEDEVVGGEAKEKEKEKEGDDGAAKSI